MEPFVICTAIAAKAIVEISYDDGSTRIVELYRHGTGPDGDEVLFGYQRGGESLSGRSVGWKLFKVARITAFRDTGERFRTIREDFNPTDRGISIEHCSV